jgi:membrane protease YdiL (CAAX protease family)
MIHAPAGRGLSRVGAAAGRPELRDFPIAFGYSLVIVLGELSSSWVGAIPGALVDAALVPVILTHFVVQPDARHRRMFPALALIALLRILSVAAVVPRLPEYAWYAAVGLPVLAGAFLAGRLADEPAARLGLRVTRERLDTSMSLVGYLLLRPAELTVSGDLVSTMVAMAVLAVFGGFLEEYVYRGVLQSASIDAFGSRRAGILFAATLGACMYWGSGSISFMIAMWFLGIGYGLALSRGASVWGAAGGHTIMLWGMGLVWPLLLR